MGKFRSKLKRHAKGAKWARGQSATSNPENNKHRLAARSRFFQPNLNAAANGPSKANGLTAEAVSKHDARQSYAANGTAKVGSKTEATVHDIAQSLHSFSMADGDDKFTFAKTFQTFGSQYSSCTNMTFNKFLNRFQQSSDLHKEMLAILSAVTEVIKERNGTQSSTEFFLGLMETLDSVTDEKDIIATLSLLTMVIKSVPQPVLREKFKDSGETYQKLLEHFTEHENPNALRGVIGCVSVLLRAQDYASWSAELTLQLFNQTLPFVIHTKPNVRKAGQRAIESIIHGSCFMLPPDESDRPPVHFHPAGTYLTRFVVDQFRLQQNIAKSQTIVLHTIELLKKTMSHLSNDDIKSICEHLLSIMVTSKVTVQKMCFDTLHQLFASKSANLSQDLCGKLIAAIYNYRPERTDVALTLAWLNVIKLGHVCLTAFSADKCIRELPRLMAICAGDIWRSDDLHIATGAYHTVRELFEECVRPACATLALATQHQKPIVKMLNEVARCLLEPFGHVAQQIVGAYQTVFEVCGRHFCQTLQPALNQIAGRYDDTAAKQIAIESAFRAAIKAMGPQAAIAAAPLTDAAGDVIITRLWVLQALKKAVGQTSLGYFIDDIVPLANKCYDKWRKPKDPANLAAARSNELFYVQLWDLFPSFCDDASDRELKKFARQLGTELKDRPEIRVAICEGLKKLLASESEEIRVCLRRLARNYLNILFTIYESKPKQSEEHASRAHALQAVVEYLKLADGQKCAPPGEHVPLHCIKCTLDELFQSVLSRYNAKEAAKDAKESKSKRDAFQCQAYFDLLLVLAVYQTPEQLATLFEDYIRPALENAKTADVAFKGRQAKSYEMLKNILESEAAGCKAFVAKHILAVQAALLNTLQNRKSSSQDMRLTCLKLLIDKKEANTHLNSKLITRTIPEIVMSFNYTGKSAKNNVALHLLQKVADIYKNANKVNTLAELVMTGLDAEADDTLVANTIQVLHALLQNYTDQLTPSTLNAILDQIVAQLITGSRQKVKPAIAFVLMFTKILPASYVANHLANIVRALSAMKPDTKRFYRKQLGFVYTRLCKRYTPEEIVQLVPGNDEITHRRLKNIRKALARAKRQKAAKGGDSDDDNDADEAIGSDEDILSDDSDDELQEDILMGNENGANERPKKKARAVEEKYIYEDADTIVDLADIKAMSSIATTKPTKQIGGKAGQKDKARDPNRGFKMDVSGKLIIEEPKRGKAGHDDSDSDDDMDSGDGEAAKQPNEANADDDDDDDSVDEATENAKMKARKRKASSAISQASGKTGTASRYVSGGKGIHRSLNGASTSAASTRTGHSMASGRTAATAKTAGSDYKSNKATGDIKRKGSAYDPYAYIPLSRNSLNKRKRAKSAGQFKSIVSGARKGAAAGSKRRKV